MEEIPKKNRIFDSFWLFLNNKTFELKTAVKIDALV